MRFGVFIALAAVASAVNLQSAFFPADLAKNFMAGTKEKIKSMGESKAAAHVESKAPDSTSKCVKDGKMDPKCRAGEVDKALKDAK